MKFHFFSRAKGVRSPYQRGLRYEAEVCRWLKKNNGFTILERNYRSGKYEIDIIAKKELLLIFVEVKARKDFLRWDPLQRVDREKVSHIRYAAEKYLNELKREGIDTELLTVRFDVACVEINSDDSPGEIHYYPDYREVHNEVF